MSDEAVPLKEFLESWHDAHSAVHVEEQRAREEAAKRIDGRLAALNELRAEVLTDRAQLISREVFDAQMKALDVRISALHDQITEWRGRNKGLGLSGQIVLGTVTVISTLLAVVFAVN